MLRERADFRGAWRRVLAAMPKTACIRFEGMPARAAVMDALSRLSQSQ